MKVEQNGKIQYMAKGERLPKHSSKIHSHTDAEYNFYYLLDANDKIVATLAKPRHRGVDRKLIYTRKEQ